MKKIFLSVALLLSCMTVSAQNKISFISVNFPIGSKTIDSAYGNNAQSLSDITTLMKSLEGSKSLKLREIVLNGSSSPEGVLADNKELANDRLEALEKYITSNVATQGVPVRKELQTVDMSMLKTWVENSNMPAKDEVLNIISEDASATTYNNKEVDARVLKLMQLNGGKSWEYINQNYLAHMRSASVTFFVENADDTKQNTAVYDGELEKLRNELSSLRSNVASMQAAKDEKPCCEKMHKERKLKQTTSDDDYEKFRFGGYGEMVASFKDYKNNRFYGNSEGNPKDHRNTISIPRFVLAFDYKFTPKWILGAEIEFESGGVGTAYEIENSENGEYETEVEKGGEVALEQFHITRLIVPQFNVRAGHIILPVGLTNAHHEPINFFGTTRPEGETTIIPSTWHENGIEFFGTLGKSYYTFDYQAMITSGLNACGFDRNNWVQGGKQGIFEEDNFTSPAYVFRLDYRGVPGLRVGASFYYCANTAANSDKLTEYSFKAPLRIYTADAQYKNKYVTARANLIWGNMTNADLVSGVNTKLSNKSPYTRIVPVAKKAVSFGGEVGFNAGAFINKCPGLYAFARYDYFNPQKECAGLYTEDKRCEVSKWTFGVNWFALPNLVVKADYMTRQIGTSKMFGHGKYNSENEFSIGIAYIGWFTKR